MGDEEIAVLKAEFRNLVEKVDRNAEISENWRVLFCGKLDKVLDRLQSLPCDKRSYIPTQINALWGVIVLLIAAIIGEWVKK